MAIWWVYFQYAHAGRGARLGLPPPWDGVYWISRVIQTQGREERSKLFQQFLQYFPERQIACLTAEREFIGQEWFCYLQAKPLLSFLAPYPWRITNSMMADAASKCKPFLATYNPDNKTVLRHQRKLWGYWLYIAALRFKDGFLLVVATQSAPKTAIANYANRWGIETLFGIFTPRGFCLESTHLTDSERLSKLLALLTLALYWAMPTGECLHQIKPLTLKKHGRRAKSMFRYGFDYIRTLVLILEPKADEFVEVLQFLSCS